ncbi:DMT family transporter [Lacticaseibacillus baoqingensis]|uniref:DMT family transporter n=1 Tax=Lacticaseibacillus baoqingensis TaxID=2486013 RepID=A0ABW4E460_9LACO|nr:DMT family transporter [Lacticaseibacillus baoqingensis]
MRRTLGYVLLSTLLFSSMEIALKLAGASFGALQLNFLRFLIGGVILVPFAMSYVRKNQLRLLPHLSLFLATGLVCVLISMTLYQLAVISAPASMVAVIFSINPVFALLFSFLILHERLSRTSIISVVVSVIGLLVIIDPAHLSNPAGLLLALTSAVTFGLYSILSRRGSQKYGYNGITMTAFTFIAGALELLVLIGLSYLPIAGHLFAHSPQLTAAFVRIPIIAGITWAHLPLLAYIGIGVTGLGFAFYFLAMERSDVSTASLVFFIKPGLAPIMATILLHENITVTTIIGVVIILIGSVISFINQEFMERVGAMLPFHSHHNNMLPH